MWVLHTQGEELSNALRCTFSNSTYQTTITPSLVNSSAARCTAPPWSVGAGGAAVELTLTSGKCSLRLPYFYYQSPLVRAVQPLLAPRYGSFQMTVFVDQDLQAITGDQVWSSPLPVVKACASSSIVACQLHQPVPNLRACMCCWSSMTAHWHLPFCGRMLCWGSLFWGTNLQSCT